VVPPTKADSNDRSVVRLGCVAENRGVCAGQQQRGATISPCFSGCQKHDQLKGTKAPLKDFTENFERTKPCSLKSPRKSLLGNQCIQL